MGREQGKLLSPDHTHNSYHLPRGHNHKTKTIKGLKLLRKRETIVFFLFREKIPQIAWMRFRKSRSFKFIGKESGNNRRAL